MLISELIFGTPRINPAQGIWFVGVETRGDNGCHLNIIAWHIPLCRRGGSQPINGHIKTIIMIQIYQRCLIKNKERHRFDNGSRNAITHPIIHRLINLFIAICRLNNGAHRHNEQIDNGYNG